MATGSGDIPHITLIDFGSTQFIPPGIDVMIDIPAGNIDFVGRCYVQGDLRNNTNVLNIIDIAIFVQHVIITTLIEQSLNYNENPHPFLF